MTCGLLLSLVARYWAIFGGDAWYVRAAVVLSAVYAFADTAINCTWTYRVSPETVPTELSQRVLTLESVQWAVSDFMRPLDLAQLPWQVTSFCILYVRLAKYPIGSPTLSVWKPLQLRNYSVGSPELLPRPALFPQQEELDHLSPHRAYHLCQLGHQPIHCTLLLAAR